MKILWKYIVDGCTILWMQLMPLNCTLKRLKMPTIMLFIYIFKKRTPKKHTTYVMFRINVCKRTCKRQVDRCLLINTEYVCVQILLVRWRKWFNNYNFLKYLYVHKVFVKDYVDILNVSHLNIHLYSNKCSQLKYQNLKNYIFHFLYFIQSMHFFYTKKL